MCKISFWFLRSSTAGTLNQNDQNVDLVKALWSSVVILWTPKASLLTWFITGVISDLDYEIKIPVYRVKEEKILHIMKPSQCECLLVDCENASINFCWIVLLCNGLSLMVEVEEVGGDGRMRECVCGDDWGEVGGDGRMRGCVCRDDRGEVGNFVVWRLLGSIFARIWPFFVRILGFIIPMSQVTSVSSWFGFVGHPSKEWIISAVAIKFDTQFSWSSNVMAPGLKFLLRWKALRHVCQPQEYPSVWVGTSIMV